MKFILLAAAAVIASPVIAQSTSTPAGTDASTSQSTAAPTDPAMQQQTTPTQTDPSMQQAPATDATAPATTPAPTDPSMQQTTPAPTDPSMQQPMQQQPMSGGTQTTGDSSMADPAGGYQPSQPALSGPAQPGAPITVQPSQSPSQAFPPPAPMASYPVCKKGQYDNCREGGGGARKATRRSRRR